MDIYCPRCAEPWDNDTFHDVAEELGSNYKAVMSDFYDRGCGLAFGGRQCEKVDSLRADASAAMRDLMGDDTDGIFAMLDDFDALGMLD